MTPGSDPSGQSRHETLTDRSPEHRLGEAVYLEEQDSRSVRRLGLFEVTHHPSHDVAPPHRVVVDGQQAAGSRADRGHAERGQDRGTEPVDLDPVNQFGGEEEDEAVDDETEQTGGPHQEPGSEPDHEGPDDGVDDAQHQDRERP
jgi:hypothetical protein